MLLDNKTAIVIGSAVAHAYAREGAEGHLARGTAATLEEVAPRTQRDAGNPHVTQLDVLDRTALERHAGTVAAASGGIDVCFNVTSNDDRQGTPLLDMQFEDFLRRPVTKTVTAHFHYRHRSRSADDPPGQWRHPRHGRRPGSHPPSRRLPCRLERARRTLSPARRRIRTARRTRQLAALTRLTRLQSE
jgi:Enoyl-(Acyl carrier protein) reductase